MPRFTDSWVIDSSMFSYIQGGSCACCGFAHLFNPGGIEGLINSMSDLETDAAKNEFNAAKASPWPEDMRDQIWSDRLLLRWRLKKEMAGYRTFLEGVIRRENETTTNNNNENNNDNNKANPVEDDAGKLDLERAIPILLKFCTDTLTPHQLRQIFQLPRSEVTEILKSKYKICSAYAVVFCSVVEQVSNFKITGYGVDARCCYPGNDKNGQQQGDGEILFENDLKYQKVGPGFCLNILSKNENGDGTATNGENCWEVNEDVVSRFLQRVIGLAGPTLLARAARVVASQEDDDDGSDGDGAAKKKTPDDADEDDDNNPAVSSFRSDRRVVRLLIARYWADRLIEKYQQHYQTNNKN